MIQIDDLIRQVKSFFKIEGQIRFDRPEYESFHNGMMRFIHENHFENTQEWSVISDNLIYKSTQFMVASEANAILLQLDSLKRKILEQEYAWNWDLIHPEIMRVSQKLFLDGHYADASCNAFIEINVRVKALHAKLRSDDKELDGDAVMKTVFSPNASLVEFCDRSSETGKNVQKGFMEMLAGAMSALRNPKAHANITLTADDAMRRLTFASMLMYKIDEAVIYSQIAE